MRDYVAVLLFSRLCRNIFSGGLRGEETPVPIPNTEVKGPIAEGTAGRACGRVGRRRILFQGPQALTSLRPSLFCSHAVATKKVIATTHPPSRFRGYGGQGGHKGVLLLPPSGSNGVVKREHPSGAVSPEWL
jgi:hypothetical protein